MQDLITKEILSRIENGYCEVLGAGVSNVPLVKWLSERGAAITVRDKKSRENIKYAEELEKCARLICGEEYLKGLGEQSDPYKTLIFRSPGMRPDIKEIAAAVEKGCLLTSEMELFFRLTKARIIAVTGSDGKTTTTTLVGKILEAGIEKGRVFVGGNIGKPLLPECDRMTEEDFAVVELSSFQLQTMQTSARTAVITNITENHLDWHKEMGEYTDAKYNVFRNGGCEKLIVSADNELSKNAYQLLKGGNLKKVFFSLNVESYKDIVPIDAENSEAVYERDGVIYYSDGKTENELMKSSDIKIPGRHNVLNYMAAFAATADYVSPEAVKKVAVEFGGVEHRIELVRELDGVKYYNSSIDSTPTRTNAALASFKDKVIVICGGYDKNLSYEPLAPTLCEKAKAVVLTGACADKIMAALEGYEGYKTSGLVVYREPIFESAVKKTKELAEKGDTVILSPAAASFDAFENFMVRGNTFKKIVNSFENI